MPFQEPSDELTAEVAAILMRPSSQRDRLTPDLYLGERHDEHPLKDLERAFELVVEAAPIEKKMREAKMRDPDEAKDAGTITAEEYDRLAEVKAAVRKVVEVDAFPMDEVSPIASQHDRSKDRDAVAHEREAAE